MRNYQLKPVERSCPVCYSKDAHILWIVDSNQAAQHFVIKEIDAKRFQELASHIEKLWRQKTCEVVQCNNCKFCYSNPFISGDERFYTLAYNRSGYPKWKWEFQVSYEVLTKRLKAHHMLLEIGAGNGAFVKKISPSLIPKENVLCTEYSEYGRRQIQHYGIECLSEDVRNIKKEYLGNHFNIVCMFHVLEHMDQLDILFEKLNWLTKAGGSIFMAVPNPKRIQFNELNGALLDMPPNHIGRWNRKCFEEIARKSGFYIEDYKIEKSSFIPMAKTFLIHRFKKECQHGATFANRILNIKNHYIRRASQVLGLVFSSMRALAALRRINPDMGMSHWVHLIKLDI